MLQRAAAYRRILLSAADIIRERGLSVGSLWDNEGRVCVAAAINMAATGKPSGGDCDVEGLTEAYRRIEEQLGGPAVAWNDHVGDAEQIIAALEHVALA